METKNNNPSKMHSGLKKRINYIEGFGSLGYFDIRSCGLKNSNLGTEVCSVNKKGHPSKI